MFVRLDFPCFIYLSVKCLRLSFTCDSWSFFQIVIITVFSYLVLKLLCGRICIITIFNFSEVLQKTFGGSSTSTSLRELTFYGYKHRYSRWKTFPQTASKKSNLPVYGGRNPHIGSLWRIPSSHVITSTVVKKSPSLDVGRNLRVVELSPVHLTPYKWITLYAVVCLVTCVTVLFHPFRFRVV